MMSTPFFLWESTPRCKLFLKPNSRFSTVSALVHHVMKAWVVKLNDNWRHYPSTTRYRVPFLKGIVKGANLTRCQTNQLYTGEVSTPLRHPCMCFYNSRLNDQKRLQWAGLSWYKFCLVFVPTRSTTSKRIDDRNVIGLEAWNLMQNTAVRCHKWGTLSRNQSFQLVFY